MRTFGLLLLSIGFLSLVSAAGAEIVYPDAAAVVNLKQPPYNAKGDGVTDDTAAIKKAINDHVTKARILYFPDGTYLISEQLDWKNEQGQWGGYLTFQGQSRDKTVLKLKDKATGFADVSNPRSMIRTGSLRSTSDIGGGANGFGNYVMNMTLDVGAGNPGACGVDFLANNFGALTDLSIRSTDPASGLAGVIMRRQMPGPALLRDVSIDGFATGVQIRWGQYSMTFERLTLTNQREAGILNSGNTLAIRGLTSKLPANVPAIRSTGEAALVNLIDADLTGQGPAAIENATGLLYVRNVKTAGYAAAIKSKDQTVAGPAVDEFVSGETVTLFGNKSGSLKLPIADPPAVADYPPDQWANVMDFGAQPNDDKDDSDAIQKAIDSGKPVVYFPQAANPGLKEGGATWHFAKPVVVRGKVRQIKGLYGIALPVAGGSFDDQRNPQPFFRVEDVDGPDVMIEQFMGLGWLAKVKGYELCEVASTKPVYIRQIEGGIANAAPKDGQTLGPLFLEDMPTALKLKHPQKVWGRQINPEGNTLKVENRGGDLWVLGLKTEIYATIVKTTHGGRTEILGGFFYPVFNGPDELMPMFITIDASMSASYVGFGVAQHAVQAIETHNGDVKVLGIDQVHHRMDGQGKLPIPLVAMYRADHDGVGNTPAGVGLSPAGTLIIDNNSPAVKQVGPWQVSSTPPANNRTQGFIGKDYLLARPADKALATYPAPEKPGTYRVYISFCPGEDRASNAPVTVEHVGGKTELTVNQKRATGPNIWKRSLNRWALLGTFKFDGASQQITVGSENADGLVSADGVRFVPAESVPAILQKRPGPDNLATPFTGSNVETTAGEAKPPAKANPAAPATPAAAPTTMPSGGIPISFWRGSKNDASDGSEFADDQGNRFSIVQITGGMTAGDSYKPLIWQPDGFWSGSPMQDGAPSFRRNAKGEIGLRARVGAPLPALVIQPATAGTYKLAGELTASVWGGGSVAVLTLIRQPAGGKGVVLGEVEIPEAKEPRSIDLAQAESLGAFKLADGEKLVLIGRPKRGTSWVAFAKPDAAPVQLVPAAADAPAMAAPAGRKRAPKPAGDNAEAPAAPAALPEGTAAWWTGTAPNAADANPHTDAAGHQWQAVYSGAGVKAAGNDLKAMLWNEGGFWSGPVLQDGAPSYRNAKGNLSLRARAGAAIPGIAFTPKEPGKYQIGGKLTALVWGGGAAAVVTVVKHNAAGEVTQVAEFNIAEATKETELDLAAAPGAEALQAIELAAGERLVIFARPRAGSAWVSLLKGQAALTITKK